MQNKVNAIFFFVQSPSFEQLGSTYFRQLKTTLSINRKYFDYSILYTTENTQIPPDTRFDAVIRMHSRYRYYPHFMRVMSWLEYMESTLFDCDTVFLDADVVFHRRIDEVFKETFGLAFCATPSPRTYSNVNSGCIFAKYANRQKAQIHAKNLFEIAKTQRLIPEPRFPQFKYAGIWGGDEMCINTYLEELAKQKNMSLRDLCLSVKFDSCFNLSDDVALFGAKYCSDPRSIDRSKWPSASILHFAGPQKEAMFQYCSQLDLISRSS